LERAFAARKTRAHDMNCRFLRGHDNPFRDGR
jgi:hypothetical protein